MSFTRKLTSILFNFEIDSSSTQKVALIKYLVIVFDTELLFESHLYLITSNAYTNLDFIFRNTSIFFNKKRCLLYLIVWLDLIWSIYFYHMESLLCIPKTYPWKIHFGLFTFGINVSYIELLKFFTCTSLECSK